MTPLLIQFDSGYFCAVIETDGERVTYAAPILAYMRGWTLQRALGYARKKGWGQVYCGPTMTFPEKGPVV